MSNSKENVETIFSSSRNNNDIEGQFFQRRISKFTIGNTNYEDSLLLKPLNEKEVIKVPKCNFNNDIKHSTTYYFCQCSEEMFYPVCIACAETCHKHHEPSLKMEGVYECQCGISNHNIGPEYDERFRTRRETNLNECMFSKFFNQKDLETRGFFYVPYVLFNMNKNAKILIFI